MKEYKKLLLNEAEVCLIQIKNPGDLYYITKDKKIETDKATFFNFSYRDYELLLPREAEELKKSCIKILGEEREFITIKFTNLYQLFNLSNLTKKQIENIIRDSLRFEKITNWTKKISKEEGYQNEEIKEKVKELEDLEKRINKELGGNYKGYFINTKLKKIFKHPLQYIKIIESGTGGWYGSININFYEDEIKLYIDKDLRAGDNYTFEECIKKIKEDILKIKKISEKLSTLKIE